MGENEADEDGKINNENKDPFEEDEAMTERVMNVMRTISSESENEAMTNRVMNVMKNISTDSEDEDEEPMVKNKSIKKNFLQDDEKDEEDVVENATSRKKPLQIEDEDEEDSRSLVDYRHLAKELIELWPDAKCGEFLEMLLHDNRDGVRQGFPRSVAEEIALLQRVLRERLQDNS